MKWINKSIKEKSLKGFRKKTLLSWNYETLSQNDEKINQNYEALSHNDHKYKSLSEIISQNYDISFFFLPNF